MKTYVVFATLAAEEQIKVEANSPDEAVQIARKQLLVNLDDSLAGCRPRVWAEEL